MALPNALADTLIVTIQVYDSLSIVPGDSLPTSAFSTVSAGAIVAPPSARARPSVTGLGMAGRISRLEG